MKPRYRHPLMVQALAAAVALAAAAQGSGVPMCVSLLAEATAPCAMHMPVHAMDDAGGATLVATPAGHGTCHVDAASLGCAAGGTCPTGGTAAPAWLSIRIAPRVALRAVVSGQSAALISYLAPPLAPPPQA